MIGSGEDTPDFRTQDHLIREFAQRLLKYSAAQNKGCLPFDREGWESILEREGLEYAPAEAVPASFTARLTYVEERDFWLIGYNPSASDRRVCRYYCHEYGEYLTQCDLPHLWDGMDELRTEATSTSYVFYYDGGGDPQDIRHRIACEYERLVFGER